MTSIQFHPALHPFGFGWDEYLFLALGILALIVIAAWGGKPGEKASNSKPQTPNPQEEDSRSETQDSSSPPPTT
jgi:hypothetical protein